MLVKKIAAADTHSVAPYFCVRGFFTRPWSLASKLLAASYKPLTLQPCYDLKCGCNEMLTS